MDHNEFSQFLTLEPTVIGKHKIHLVYKCKPNQDPQCQEIAAREFRRKRIAKIHSYCPDLQKVQYCEDGMLVRIKSVDLSKQTVSADFDWHDLDETAVITMDVHYRNVERCPDLRVDKRGFLSDFASWVKDFNHISLCQKNSLEYSKTHVQPLLDASITCETDSLYARAELRSTLTTRLEVQAEIGVRIT